MKAYKSLMVILSSLLSATTVLAHDPVFGAGPHVLFKDGVEMHLGVNHEKASNDRITEAEVQLKYGLTGDWVAGIGVPYARSESLEATATGRGPTSLSTKYRFWRNDLFGSQESAAVLGKVILDDSSGNSENQARRDGNDYLLGITYGYEGRRWYRWASVRRGFNKDAANGTERPDIWLVDLVVGIRPTATEYLEPDWVWILELNGEITENVTQLMGNTLVRTGGPQWFLSPGFMWTNRNLAIKTGVQLSLYDQLAADQEPDDYRVQFESEWHF